MTTTRFRVEVIGTDSKIEAVIVLIMDYAINHWKKQLEILLLWKQFPVAAAARQRT